MGHISLQQICKVKKVTALQDSFLCTGGILCSDTSAALRNIVRNKAGGCKKRNWPVDIMITAFFIRSTELLFDYWILFTLITARIIMVGMQ